MKIGNPEDNFKLCEQRKRILNEDGHMLVVGGPGSGKTTIALLKARRRVLEQLNSGQKVLFLSFSNSAIRRIMESAGRILTDEIANSVDIKTSSRPGHPNCSNALQQRAPAFALRIRSFS